MELSPSGFLSLFESCFLVLPLLFPVVISQKQMNKDSPCQKQTNKTQQQKTPHNNLYFGGTQLKANLILKFIESLLCTQFIVRVNYARKVESASSPYKTSPITQPHPPKSLRDLALLITLLFPIFLSYISLFQALY